MEEDDIAKSRVGNTLVQRETSQWGRKGLQAKLKAVALGRQL